jgi:hypothetical protein
MQRRETPKGSSSRLRILLYVSFFFARRRETPKDAESNMLHLFCNAVYGVS